MQISDREADQLVLDLQEHMERTRWIDRVQSTLLSLLLTAFLAWEFGYRCSGGPYSRYRKLAGCGIHELRWYPSWGVPAVVLGLLAVIPIHRALRARRARRFMWG